MTLTFVIMAVNQEGAGSTARQTQPVAHIRNHVLVK